MISTVMEHMSEAKITVEDIRTNKKIAVLVAL